MRASIFALATEVPESILLPERFQLAAHALLHLQEDEIRLLKKVMKGSQIEKRHIIVSDFLNENFTGDFFGRGKKRSFPKTGKRNDLYKVAAPKLAASVCQRAIENWQGNRQQITHIISVSCTGMIAPGIECLLIDKLGLSEHVERLGINFMGCFGAFKGLAIAKALALENPEHRILLVCTELCSLHFQEDNNKDTLVANALFADGAAAVIVGTLPRKKEHPLFEIHHQRSLTVKNTLEKMTWEASDSGYKMRLCETIPTSLENHILPFVEKLKGSIEECAWAVHPGGKAILDGIQRACKLEKKALFASWNVLKEYGNMSSPTFLFVLKELLSYSQNWIVGLGFGPGLSIEGLLLKRVENVAK